MGINGPAPDQPGSSDVINSVPEEFTKDLFSLVNQYVDLGISCSEVCGCLDVVKHTLIDQIVHKTEDESARVSW
jgi:hypothetical protein